MIAAHKHVGLLKKNTTASNCLFVFSDLPLSAQLRRQIQGRRTSSLCVCMCASASVF